MHRRLWGLAVSFAMVAAFGCGKQEPGAVQEQVAGLRRFGAPALDLAWVSAGRLDGYWERDIKSWDIAAGLILVREAGGDGLFVKTDVAQTAQVQGLVQKTVEKFGRLDVAFNNAGIEGNWIPIAEQSEEDWDRLMAINLKGVWLCLKCEIQQMLKQGGGGAIVNMSSIARHGNRGQSSCGAAKAAVPETVMARRGLIRRFQREVQVAGPLHIQALSP